MNDFNNVPNRGSFGGVVSTINQNFSLAKQAIEQALSQNVVMAERIDRLSLERVSCVGIYATKSDLETDNPNPIDNNWAIVGTTDPYVVYIANEGEWVNSGGELTLVVDLSDYVLLSDYNTEQTAQDNRLSDLEDFQTAQQQENEELASSIQEVASDIPTIVNNLVDGGVTKTLSAEMGKAIGVRVSGLEASLSELPKIARRERLASGFVATTVVDTYDVGTKLYVSLSNGKNTFTNLKTKQFLGDWQVVPLTINSCGKSIAEIVKVDENDWMLVKIHVEINGDNVTSADNTVGALTGGVFGSNNLGLTSASSAFTIACKFRMPETMSANGYLFANGVLSLLIFNNRRSVMLSSASTIVESATIELGKEYEVVATYDNGSGTLVVNEASTSFTGKSLGGTEVIPQIGSSRSSGDVFNPFGGMIKSLKVYKAVITDADELAATYSTHSDLVLNVQPQTIMPDGWLDLSSKMNLFRAPRETAGRMGVAYGDTNCGGDKPDDSPLKDIAKVNLFSTSELVEGKILDGRWGTMGSWTEEYCAVAKVPITKGKYYVIINPYLLTRPTRIGVMNNSTGTDYGSGDSRANIIMPSGSEGYPTTAKYVIARAIFNTNPSVDIDTMTFIAYRVPKTYPYPIDVSMIEVYEMDTVNDAINYVNARISEDKELNDNINIDRKLLSSTNVGTLTSMLKDSSMVILGDSITANHGWSNYVANKLKWKNTYNIAIGGANIIGREDTGNTTKRNLVYQIKQMANFLGDVCYSEGTLDNSVYTKKMDKVFISMGYNDAHNGFFCGSWNDVKDVKWQDLAPASTTNDFSSIAAAIKYCVNYMRNTIITGTYNINGNTINTAIDCRDARIIWQTPIPTSADWGAGYGDQAVDMRMRRVEDVIIDVCAGLSIPVIIGRLQVGFTRNECDKYLADGTHPNAAGYIKMGEMNLAGILAGGYPAKMTRREVIQPTVIAKWTYIDNDNQFSENQLFSLLDTYYGNWRTEDNAMRLAKNLVNGVTVNNANTSRAFYDALNNASNDLRDGGYDTFSSSSLTNRIRLTKDTYVDVGVVDSINLLSALPTTSVSVDGYTTGISGIVSNYAAFMLEFSTHDDDPYDYVSISNMLSRQANLGGSLNSYDLTAVAVAALDATIEARSGDSRLPTIESRTAKPVSHTVREYTPADEFVFRFKCSSVFSSNITLPVGVSMANGYDLSVASAGDVYQMRIQGGMASFISITPNS